MRKGEGARVVGEGGVVRVKDLLRRMLVSEEERRGVGWGAVGAGEGRLEGSVGGVEGVTVAMGRRVREEELSSSLSCLGLVSGLGGAGIWVKENNVYNINSGNGDKMANRFSYGYKMIR